MKFTTKLTIVFAFVSIVFSKQIVAQRVHVNFDFFYTNLSPYGQWIDYPGYGYAWVPSVDSDFIPYSTGGYWVLSDYGWTWVSDYKWGWAPFHYGRWDYDYYYGWVWIPDTEWGPAWVLWRRCPGYYGWAPLGPGISVNIAVAGTYVIPADHWVFVQEQYIGRQDMDKYYGPRKEYTSYLDQSKVINHTYADAPRNAIYMAGPRKDEVEKVVGTPVKPVVIRENATPEQELKNNELKMYRPAIASRGDLKPAKVADKKDIKPISERVTNAKPENNNSPKNNNENRVVPEKPLNDSRTKESINKEQPRENSKQVLPEENIKQEQPKENNKQEQPREINKQNLPKEKTQSIEPQQKANPIQKEEPRQEKELQPFNKQNPEIKRHDLPKSEPNTSPDKVIVPPKNIHNNDRIQPIKPRPVPPPPPPVKVQPPPSSPQIREEPRRGPR
jgi:hypothetical protein